MSNGKFFTFPLPLLALQLPQKETLQHIVSHALQRAGSGGQAETIPDEKVKASAKEQSLYGFSLRNECHARLVRGALVCGVTIGDISASLGRAKAADNFLTAHEAKHGKSPLVFISSDLLWGCHNDDSPKYREFTTLCAVNSIIGFKVAPILVRRAMITARQIGYKTPTVMRAELTVRTDQKPLSVQELRSTLDNLEDRQLFARYQASRRNVYFSTTLAYEDLKKAVDKLRANRNRTALRRELEAATRTIPELNHLKRKLRNEGESQPLKKEQPEPNHTATTNPTTKINALKEMPLNKSEENSQKLLKNEGEAPTDARPFSPETLAACNKILEESGLPPLKLVAAD